ncbi:MAG: hypothetical protein AVDCRST_MAG93-736, partial [uncultured Chloroflexia bacterium]
MNFGEQPFQRLSDHSQPRASRLAKHRLM